MPTLRPSLGVQVPDFKGLAEKVEVPKFQAPKFEAPKFEAPKVGATARRAWALLIFACLLRIPVHVMQAHWRWQHLPGRFPTWFFLQSIAGLVVSAL